MKNKVLLFMLTALCLLCICGFTAERYRPSLNAIIFSYPECSACGGNQRIFTYIDGTSTHSVSCKKCGTELLVEKCFALTEATCDYPGICVCDNPVIPATEHELTIMAMNEYTHDEVCTLSNCSCNPFSPYFTGSHQSYDHTYTGYTYGDYYHNSTGALHHKKVRYCTECGYEDYHTIPCGYPQQITCPGRAICFHEAENQH